jgi:hypothetical protein
MRQLQIYQIKVILTGTHLPVWRRIQVPGNTTLLKRHEILQIVMGWEDYHLHMFTIEGSIFGDPADDEYGDLGTIDKSRIKLNQVIYREGQRFSYEYDFGDSRDHTLLAAAELSSAITDFEYGSQCVQQAQQLLQQLGDQRGEIDAQYLGETAQKMGEHASARELLCESLRIRHNLGLPRGFPYSFELLAQVNESEERYERAVQLLAAAENLRIRIGAPLEQVAQKHVTAILTGARARLGDVVFELEWAKGAHLTTEQAIAIALS